jgi:hypothetical protein
VVTGVSVEPTAFTVSASGHYDIHTIRVHRRSLQIYLQQREPAAAPNRKFLHDLTPARHFKQFFVTHTIRKFIMQIEKSGCAVTIQCAREHFTYCAAAHPGSLEGTLVVSLL